MTKILLIGLVSAALGVGCSSTASKPDGGNGTGGVAAAGGSTGTGGVAAAGGSTGAGGGSVGTGGSDGGGGDAHGDAHNDASDGGAGCATAVAQGACGPEGAVCNSGCTDVCQLCNHLRCTGGHWQPEEVAPAPCFACGPTLRCQINAQYCHVQEGGAITNPPVYQCRVTPATCLPTPTCPCLRTQGLAEIVCSDGDAGAGQVTTRLQVP
ncbi:MAG TPA: hypothetical protein VFH68_11750 [Polyangia bacterium]|jgi:hypothetical protein|nr:hypothetical protein [Polyangia bacterium]